MNQLKIARIDADACPLTPAYETAGAACFDVRATEGGVVPAHGSAMFKTGWAFEVPSGYVMNVYSRSGHGFKNDIRLSNCVGKIDSDYRGELMVKLRADGEDYTVKPGERIAQCEVVPCPRWELVEVPYTELSETERGANGGGSTGKV